MTQRAEDTIFRVLSGFQPGTDLEVTRLEVLFGSRNFYADLLSKDVSAGMVPKGIIAGLALEVRGTALVAALRSLADILEHGLAKADREEGEAQ